MIWEKKLVTMWPVTPVKNDLYKVTIKMYATFFSLTLYNSTTVQHSIQ